MNAGPSTSRSDIPAPGQLTQYDRTALVATILGSDRVTSSRRYIALTTVLIGLAALVSVPAPGVSTAGHVITALVGLSTVPVALAWYTWPRVATRAAWFVAYADVGITVVVATGFAAPFDAMPGIATLSAVSFLLILFATRRAVFLHTAYAAVVLAAFVVACLIDGADLWLLLSRAATISGLLVLPLAFDAFYRTVLDKIISAQSDDATGLRNRMGFEAATTTGRGATFVAISIRVFCPARDETTAASVPADAMARLAVDLHRLAARGAIVARTGRAEFTVGSWVRTIGAASDLVETWNRELRSLNGRDRSGARAHPGAVRHPHHAVSRRAAVRRRRCRAALSVTEKQSGHRGPHESGDLRERPVVDVVEEPRPRAQGAVGLTVDRGLLRQPEGHDPVVEAEEHQDRSAARRGVTRHAVPQARLRFRSGVEDGPVQSRADTRERLGPAGDLVLDLAEVRGDFVRRGGHGCTAFR